MYCLPPPPGVLSISWAQRLCVYCHMGMPVSMMTWSWALPARVEHHMLRARGCPKREHALEKTAGGLSQGPSQRRSQRRRRYGCAPREQKQAIIVRAGSRSEMCAPGSTNLANLCCCEFVLAGAQRYVFVLAAVCAWPGAHTWCASCASCARCGWRGILGRACVRAWCREC